MGREIDHLNTLWKLVKDKETGETYYRANKSTELIIPKVEYCSTTRAGNLNNDDWEFKAPYACRDALGLSLDQRFKGKKPYMVWTQSPYIHFKEGDSLKSKLGLVSLTVLMSTPMSRLRDSDKIDFGMVEFKILKLTNEGQYRYHSIKTMDQYEFLEALIYGLPAKMLADRQS